MSHRPKLTLVQGRGRAKRSRMTRPPRLSIQPLVYPKLPASDELQFVCATLGDNLGPLGNCGSADIERFGDSGMSLEELDGRLLEHGRMVTLVSRTAQHVFTGVSVTSVDMGALKERKPAQADDFASRLRSVVGDYNHTDLAKICGCSRPAAGRWFSGGGIAPAHLFVLSRHLDVNPEWLATGIGKKTRAPQCVHDDIPEKDIELIRAFSRIPGEVQQQIRNLVESLIIR